MAVVTVSFQGARVNTAEATTNWTGATATPTLETDFKYQGTTCISAAIKTTESGFYYRQAGTTHDFSPGHVWLAKVIATNKDALDGNGLVLEMGNGTRTAYSQYFIYNASTYPIAGGWVIIPLCPNIALPNATVGSPNITAIDFFGVRADFNATSKAPNLGMDAIDYIANGTGLSLVGGDGADTDGNFLDFLNFDEGNSANRYGIVSSRDGILYVVGTLMIAGNGNTATGFTDSNKVIVFPSGLFGTGFAGIYFNLVNASTSINISSCTFNGRGTQGTNDTRPDYFVNNTNGTATFTSNSFNTFRNFTLTSAATVTDCSFTNGLLVTQAGSTITGCNFSGQTTAASVAYMLSSNPQLISNCSFTLSGGTGHAIRCNTPGTYNFSGNQFSGYGANGSSSAAFHNASAPVFANTHATANATASLNGSTSTGFAQSFQTSANLAAISAAVFKLKRTGTLTGTIVAKIYSHVGSLGSGTPGILLATSASQSAGSLSTTSTDVTFLFSSGGLVNLSASTLYFVAIEYTGTGGTVDVSGDNTLSSAGNGAQLVSGSWSIFNTLDFYFISYRNGKIVLNITNGGGTPTVFNNTGCVTEINNAVSLTVTVLNTFGAPIQNARVAIYKTSDNSEITNQLTDVNGQITSSYAYLSNESIYVRVRKSSTGTTRYVPNDSSGTITASGFTSTISLLTDSTASP